MAGKLATLLMAAALALGLAPSIAVAAQGGELQAAPLTTMSDADLPSDFGDEGYRVYANGETGWSLLYVDGKSATLTPEIELYYEGDGGKTLINKDAYTVSYAKTWWDEEADEEKSETVEPPFGITDEAGTTTLKSGTDYTISYKNNINAGTATVTVTGKGNYTGAKSATFKINKAKQPMTAKAVNKTAKIKTLKKKAVTLTKFVTVKKKQGTLSYKNVSKTKKLKKFKVNAKNGTITVPKGTKKGTYKIKVKVTAKGNANYKSGSKTVTVKIKVK